MLLQFENESKSVDSRLVGDAELPDVEDAFSLLVGAVNVITEALQAGLSDGVGIETLARLLAALKAVEQLDGGVLALQAALWESSLRIRFSVESDDSPRF
jgi:hypothetical protein